MITHVWSSCCFLGVAVAYWNNCTVVLAKTSPKFARHWVKIHQNPTLMAFFRVDSDAVIGEPNWLKPATVTPAAQILRCHTTIARASRTRCQMPVSTQASENQPGISNAFCRDQAFRYQMTQLSWSRLKPRINGPISMPPSFNRFVQALDNGVPSGLKSKNMRQLATEKSKKKLIYDVSYLLNLKSTMTMALANYVARNLCFTAPQNHPTLQPPGVNFESCPCFTFLSLAKWYLTAITVAVANCNGPKIGQVSFRMFTFQISWVNWKPYWLTNFHYSIFWAVTWLNMIQPPETDGNKQWTRDFQKSATSIHFWSKLQ